MAKTNERNDRRIDLLYKNLEHVSAAYFAAEGVYPSWEAAFALIIGQIFIAYYGQNMYPSQKMQLALFGAFLSLTWFIMVSLNLQYALHISEKAKELQNCLADQIIGKTAPHKFTPHKFVRPWIDSKESWKLKNILLGTLPGEEFEFAKVVKSTWFYRRVLPFFLLVIWIILSVGPIWGFFGAVVISILIMQLLDASKKDH